MLVEHVTPASAAAEGGRVAPPRTASICYAPRFCMNCLLRTTFKATPDCYPLNSVPLKTPEPKTLRWRCTKPNQQPASMNKQILANSTKSCAAIAREKKTLNDHALRV